MNFRSLINTNMGLMMLASFFLSVLIPIIFITIEKRVGINTFLRIILLILYMAAILYLTVIDRTPGESRSMNLVPFWSYEYFEYPQYRWQIFMNVFLFIPLGFLIPFASNKKFIFTILIGLIISILIELIQYVLALGLCEFDDAFHNVLGTILGYNYWIILNRLANKKVR